MHCSILVFPYILSVPFRKLQCIISHVAMSHDLVLSLPTPPPCCRRSDDSSHQLRYQMVGGSSLALTATHCDPHSMSMGFLVEERTAIVWRGLMVGYHPCCSLSGHPVPPPSPPPPGDVRHSEATERSGLGRSGCTGCGYASRQWN